MRTISLIALKEIRHGLNSQFAYLLFLVFVTVPPVPLFWGKTHHNIFLSRQADLQAFFGLLPLIMIIFIPALVMRAWAEERRSGTLELMMALPLTDPQLVSGKFIGYLILCVGCLVGTGSLPLLVAAMGPLDWGPVISGYCGGIFLCATCLAICFCVGSFTRNHVSAFILGFITLAALMFVPIPAVNLHARFVNIARGVLDSRDLCFYLIITILCLFLNVQSIKVQR